MKKTKEGIVQTEAEFLAEYRPELYEHPSDAVDLLLFTMDNKHVTDVRKDAEKELKFLMIKRNQHPDLGKWALPGSFVGVNEDVESAAYRELSEKANLPHVYMEQLYTFGKVGRDKRTRVISICYMALIPKEQLGANQTQTGGSQPATDEIAWFSVRKELISEAGDGTPRVEHLVIENEEQNLRFTYRIETAFEKNGVVPIPKPSIKVEEEDNRIAFDHIEMINMGIDRLRNKVEYVPIAFNLVPEKFALNDLQKVYEILLGRPLVKQNFRKWVKPYVEELNEKQEEVGHRPAALYRYTGKMTGSL